MTDSQVTLFLHDTFQPTPMPTRLFKVVTLSVHRTHQLIEAQNESEALQLANYYTRTGNVIDRCSVVTVTGAGRGGNCHV